MATRSEHEVLPTHVMTVPTEKAPSFAAQPHTALITKPATWGARVKPRGSSSPA